MHDDRRLQVIILSAGRGRRLGRDKPTLQWGARTLIEHVAAQFPPSAVAGIVVVANPDNAGAVRAAVGDVAAVTTNALVDADMLSSVRCGIAACAIGSAAALGPYCVHPVDVFGVTPELVAALHGAWRADCARMHVPIVCGRRAHPLILPVEIAQRVDDIPLGHGLNYLLHSRPESVAEMVWPDERLLGEIDTPEDYLRFRPV